MNLKLRNAGSGSASSQPSVSAEKKAEEIKAAPVKAEAEKVEKEETKTEAAPAATAEKKEKKEDKKEDKKLHISLSKAVKKVEIPEEGVRISRDVFIREYQEFLKNTGIECFENVTLSNSEKFWAMHEDFVSKILTEHPSYLFGFQFKHKQKAATFREPLGDILYVSAHKEICMKKDLGAIRKICRIAADGTFSVGSYEKSENGERTFVADTNVAEVKEIEKLYKAHLKKIENNLTKEGEKAEKRKAKILDRSTKLL